MSLIVTPLRRYGVDTCEGQVLTRCCIGEICADVPLDQHVEAGAYSLEEAARHQVLKICVDVLKRQSELGIGKLRVCGEKYAERCRRKLVEYVLAKYGGPVLLVGFNNKLADLIFSFTQGYVADMEKRLYPHDFVDISNIYSGLKHVKSVVIASGFLSREEILDLVKKAKEMGKPIIMFGVLSTLYKELGVDYFCPYGLKLQRV